MQSGDLVPCILARKQAVGTAQPPPFHRLLAETKEAVTAARRHNLPTSVKLQHLSNSCCDVLCRVEFFSGWRDQTQPLLHAMGVPENSRKAVHWRNVLYGVAGSYVYALK